jgi:hypothetical protein
MFITFFSNKDNGAPAFFYNIGNFGFLLCVISYVINKFVHKSTICALIITISRRYNYSVPIKYHGGIFISIAKKIYAQAERGGRAVSYVDRAMPILTGAAANRLIAAGLPVNINGLMKF